MPCEYCKEFEDYPTVNSILHTKKGAFCHHCNTIYNLDETLLDRATLTGGSTVIFADGHCPQCGELCGNHGGDRLRCSCGWISEPLDLNFPPSIKTPIGEWFKAYRRKHSIILYDIAAAMGVKPSELSAIDCRGRIPSLDELSKFARAFYLSPEETGEMLEALTCSGGSRQ